MRKPSPPTILRGFPSGLDKGGRVVGSYFYSSVVRRALDTWYHPRVWYWSTGKGGGVVWRDGWGDEVVVGVCKLQGTGGLVAGRKIICVRAWFTACKLQGTSGYERVCACVYDTRLWGYM